MEIMEGVRIHLLLLFVTLIQGIQGQVITPPSVDVAVGDDVSLKCTTTATSGFTFSWVDASTGTVIYIGENKQSAPEEYVNFNVTEDIPAKSSTLIINSILRQDAGDYRCTVTAQAAEDPATVTVEVGSVSEPITLNITGDGSSYTYKATYEAIGSSPEETITWTLGGVTQPADSDSIVETDPQTSDDSLFDIKSVFTFPSTPENFNVTLKCIIGGHQVAKLNRQETILVDIHKPPQPEVIMIDITPNGTELTISCDDTNSEAVPAMSTLNIYSNGALITKPDSDKSVTVTVPEELTEFRCEGGNYLGNTTTSQFYGSTTAPPTTEPITEGTTTYSSAINGLGPGAYAGIAIGVIACIVIIVVIVLYFLRPECCPCFAGSGTPAPSNKPSGRAVGSSNGSGSEKDVESPLNGVKDVTAEEKLPQAAPRGHGSIQHTNDNPDQAMYAMVDKKPARGGGGAGDAPDRGSGPGQTEPQGMLYADLDLSHKAGHTDKHVPKNENDVVVYSSILV